MRNYEDILHRHRPESAHPRMRRQERAKQFMPFAALTGLGAVVHEKDRVLEPPVIKTEYSRQLLDEKLRRIQKGDTVTVLYFIPRKQEEQAVLGEYVTVTGRVVRLNGYERVLELENGTVPLEDIAELWA